MKTSELTGAALDWAVAKAKGWVTYPTDSIERGEWYHTNAAISPLGYEHNRIHKDTFSPSTDWAQGGPIIEREKISTSYDGYWVYDPTDPEDNGERWFAEDPGGRCNSYCRYGPTPLIAAMRCYVVSKLGDNIELPKELKNE